MSKTKLILYFLSFSCFLKAQVTPFIHETITSQLKDSDLVYFNQGRHNFDQDSYLEAIPHLEKIAAHTNKIPELNFLLGICYSYHVNQTLKALDYFRKAEINAEKIDGFYFNMAYAYEKNDSIDKAIGLYQKALEKSKSQPRSEEIQNEIRFRMNRCHKITEYRNKQNLVAIKNIGPPINSDASEYCPLISSNESVMIFTYRGPKSKGGKQKIKNTESLNKDKMDLYFEDIFISKKINDSVWSAPENAVNLNTTLHDAAVAINPDGSELFMYRNNGEGKGDLYLSTLENNVYTKPIYQAGLNSHEWDGSACFIPYQNTIIFASERKGGFGGKDLYTAERIKPNLWGNIKNMGPQINTKFDEDAPFVTADGKILFFSSNNGSSIGGYDIFRCDYKNSCWQAPFNLGAPINTKNDDKFFTVRGDGKVAYFSSYMQGGKGEQDIYKITPGVPGMPVEMLEVNGFVSVDGKPASAEIEINSILKHNKYNTNLRSSLNEGNFLTNLPAGDKYEVIVKTDKFPQQVIELNTVGIDSFVVLNVFAEFTSAEYDKKLDELIKSNNRYDHEKFDSKAFSQKYGNLTKEGLGYKVQIGAYKFIENFNYNNVLGFPKIIRFTENDYITRFFMGYFKTYNEAADLLNRFKNSSKHKDAFIIAEYNGKRLYLEDLIEQKIVE